MDLHLLFCPSGDTGLCIVDKQWPGLTQQLGACTHEVKLLADERQCLEAGVPHSLFLAFRSTVVLL